MKTLAILAAVLMLWCGSAWADTADEIRATYLAFAEAQNSRDAARIGGFLIDGPELLWVSDGRSVRGKDAILARMGSFQRAEVWRVEPDLDKATVTGFDGNVQMLHMPLTLVIGSTAEPSRLRFLVSLIFVRQANEWRIAALLTTTAKE